MTTGKILAIISIVLSLIALAPIIPLLYILGKNADKFEQDKPTDKIS